MGCKVATCAVTHDKLDESSYWDDKTANKSEYLQNCIVNRSTTLNNSCSFLPRVQMESECYQWLIIISSVNCLDRLFHLPVACFLQLTKCFFFGNTIMWLLDERVFLVVQVHNRLLTCKRDCLSYLFELWSQEVRVFCTISPRQQLNLLVICILRQMIINILVRDFNIQTIVIHSDVVFKPHECDRFLLHIIQISLLRCPVILCVTRVCDTCNICVHVGLCVLIARKITIIECCMGAVGLLLNRKFILRKHIPGKPVFCDAFLVLCSGIIRQALEVKWATKLLLIILHAFNCRTLRKF